MFVETISKTNIAFCEVATSKRCYACRRLEGGKKPGFIGQNKPLVCLYVRRRLITFCVNKNIIRTINISVVFVVGFHVWLESQSQLLLPLSEVYALWSVSVLFLFDIQCWFASLMNVVVLVVVVVVFVGVGLVFTFFCWCCCFAVVSIDSICLLRLSMLLSVGALECLCRFDATMITTTTTTMATTSAATTINVITKLYLINDTICKVNWNSVFWVACPIPPRLGGCTSVCPSKWMTDWYFLQVYFHWELGRVFVIVVVVVGRKQLNVGIW